MISMLRKENAEPLDIIALAGQRNMKSLDSYSSTSTEQQKSMSLKLSNYIQAQEAPSESLPAESQVPKKKFKRILPIIDSDDEL